MKIGNIEIEGQLFLAPLAGYTNTVYRTICRELGASFCVSEMISDKGLLYENQKTWEMCFINERERPTALQLFGSEIEEMVQAAILLDQKSNCDMIDINIGCPVKKVTKAGSGAALMQNIIYLEKMIKMITSNVLKPVTAKIRIGWDHNSINCVEVAKALERAGIKAITVHGRTKTDFYSGKVNYEAIKAVKEAVLIPVIGNGDIKSVADLKKMQATNVDGFMIGRASLGNPWIFKELQAYLNNEPYVVPSQNEKIDLLIRHFTDLITIKGEKIALLEMRSLAPWYVRGLANNKEFKQKIVQVMSKEKFLEILDECFREEK